MESEIIKKKKTSRGFTHYEFKDTYEDSCTIQKSSVSNYDAIWIGTSQSRMHLNRKMVAELIPILAEFVTTGNI